MSDVHGFVNAFCGTHSLNMIAVQGADYEVTNYLTTLYARPKGLTLRNLFTGWYFLEDRNYMHFHVDIRGSFVSKRVYFTQ